MQGDRNLVDTSAELPPSTTHRLMLRDQRGAAAERVLDQPSDRLILGAAQCLRLNARMERELDGLRLNARMERELEARRVRRRTARDGTSGDGTSGNSTSGNGTSGNSTSGNSTSGNSTTVGADVMQGDQTLVDTSADGPVEVAFLLMLTALMDAQAEGAFREN